MLLPPPSPPPGYRPGYLFRYPLKVLQWGSLGLLIGAALLFGMLGWQLQGRPSAPRLFLSWGELALVLVALVGVILLHELVHALSGWLLGYQVTFGFSQEMVAPYVGMFGQFVQRGHNILIALAPLLLLDALLLPLLAQPSRPLVILAFVALIANTSGAVGDLYAAWRLGRMPRGTLLYDIDPAHMLVFEPA